MTRSAPQPLDYQPQRQRLLQVSDFWAYVLPMAIFMAFTWLGSQWPGLFPLSYLLKTVLVAMALIVLWPKYTPVRWTFWWLGILVGVVGIFQWVGMQLLLQHYSDWFKPSLDVFNPVEHFQSNPAMLWMFVGVRMVGAVLVVPVMEELFWRDFLWRTILAPNDFKLAQIGEWDWKTLLIVSIAFCTVHGNWWPTAIVWGLMIGGLLVWTKSLGACIIAHAVTNLLLAGYVLHTHDWSFW